MIAELVSSGRPSFRSMRVKTKCGACGKPLGSGETIHVAGDGVRCFPCFNRETADRLGIDFDEPSFQPIVLEDADGALHTFKFRSMLVPTGHEIEAFEVTDDGRAGYRFAVLGDFEADAWELFQLLYAKLRREVATRHVHRTEFGWQLTDDQRLVGRIDWDPDSDVRLPLVVIDGKAFTWEQVGHMLMTFEGFTLEARIKDTIEVVSGPEQQNRRQT
jgi:hypothetical protein